MEGVTVLTEATNMNIWAIILPCLAFCVFFASSLLLTFTLKDWLQDYGKLSDDIHKIIIAIVMIILLIASLYMTFSIAEFIAEKSISYKITIDDSVSFNEFNAKYKVLKQDGQIFTVVEREVEQNEN